MEFLRKMAQQSAEGFKQIADEVWDRLGDMKGVPKGYKDTARTAGKYALTSQLLMTMNFPDDADILRHSFNVTGKGPTGSDGFSGTPVGDLLDAVADITKERNVQAKGTTGYSDISQTSTYDDLGNLLPMIRLMGE
jgi:hypothetical protein